MELIVGVVQAAGSVVSDSLSEDMNAGRASFTETADGMYDADEAVEAGVIFASASPTKLGVSLTQHLSESDRASIRKYQYMFYFPEN